MPRWHPAMPRIPGLLVVSRRNAAAHRDVASRSRSLMRRAARRHRTLACALALALVHGGQDDLVQRVAAAVGARDLPSGRAAFLGEADFHGTPCRCRLSFDGGGAFELQLVGTLGETVGSD